MSETSKLWIDENLAQHVLRMLQKPLSTEEVASRLGWDNITALILLRDTMVGRVIDMGTQGKVEWLAAEAPLELVVQLTPEESAGLAKEFAQIDRLKAAAPGSDEYAAAYLELYGVLPTAQHIASTIKRRTAPS